VYARNLYQISLESKVAVFELFVVSIWFVWRHSDVDSPVDS